MNTAQNFKPASIDPQHLELDALLDDVYRAHDEGFVTDDDLSYYFEAEPESHVFTADYLDEAFAGDFEEAASVVNMVGGRDLDAKIRYWRGVLARIAETS